MKSFVIILALACAANAASVDFHFNQFKVQFKRSYANEAEESLRKSIFTQNLEYINKHNAAAAKGLKSYTLAINKFADITHEEFRTNVLATPIDFHPSKPGHVDEMADPSLPAAVDWRKKGFVTPIKDQKQCGSCWAFSAVGAIEGQHFNQTGKLVSLSEQNLVDCVYTQSGCKGGLPSDGFDYVIKNKGIDTEKSYPYEAVGGKCRFTTKKVGATISSWSEIRFGRETELQKATANVGPISVGIDASHASFQFYESGVYDPDECSSLRLDHGVLVVGYDTTSDGQDYWIVKNSWGTTFGIDGYIWMARNDRNKCGIATNANYPLV